jgi:hypothetical protein
LKVEEMETGKETRGQLEREFFDAGARPVGNGTVFI